MKRRSLLAGQVMLSFYSGQHSYIEAASELQKFFC
jgi:hypothetical protein